MLNHLIAACEQVFDRIVVVVGPGMPGLEAAARPHATVVQAERLGTGHAALQAAPLLCGFDGDVAVLYADNPLIPEATLRRLLDRRAEADLALLAPGRSWALRPGADRCGGRGDPGGGMGGCRCGGARDRPLQRGRGRRPGW
jgi:bifunctional UDP-N-acetylglucosamine pyrophosphorylase/glucosamine-1-phosphate N-acetyltransferase